MLSFVELALELRGFYFWRMKGENSNMSIEEIRKEIEKRSIDVDYIMYEDEILQRQIHCNVFQKIYSFLPKKGIYFLITIGGLVLRKHVIYIGSSLNLPNRISNHINNTSVGNRFQTFSVIGLDHLSDSEVRRIEKEYIWQYSVDKWNEKEFPLENKRDSYITLNHIRRYCNELTNFLTTEELIAIEDNAFIPEDSEEEMEWSRMAAGLSLLDKYRRIDPIQIIKSVDYFTTKSGLELFHAGHMISMIEYIITGIDSHMTEERQKEVLNLVTMSYLFSGE